MLPFIKTKKREPRKFSYKGRYYNAEENKIRKEKILNGEKDTNVLFSDRFRRRLEESRKTKHASLMRIAVMAGILAALLYFFMK